MNKILITNREGLEQDQATFIINYKDANKLLPILRSDHFKAISLSNVGEVVAKDLKFLIQFTRLLKSDGEVLLDNSNNQQLNVVLKTLKLYQTDGQNNTKRFLKTKPQPKVEVKQEKLAIGFHANQADEDIDESELLVGENIAIDKKKAENCDTKPRACANCSCGRKDVQTTVSKQQLVKSVNEGNPVSGCGKCLLGDSFRCGTCPYKGMPAFKPGDKLRLQEDGAVLVQSAATFINASGKIKLQI